MSCTCTPPWRRGGTTLRKVELGFCGSPGEQSSGMRRTDTRVRDQNVDVAVAVDVDVDVNVDVDVDVTSALASRGVPPSSWSTVKGRRQRNSTAELNRQ